MTYNVSGGTLSLTQSINHYAFLSTLSCLTTMTIISDPLTKIKY